MPYRKRLYGLMLGAQINEYHISRKYIKGVKRQRKRTRTPEEMERANQRQKTLKTERLILNYFNTGDKWVTLTYSSEQAPGSIAKVQRDMKRLYEYLRPMYEAEKTPLYWIRNIERTNKGIYHIHLLINNIPAADAGQIIRNYWERKHGAIAKVQNTYINGGVRKLADYLTKTTRDESGKMVNRYSHSRNIKDVKPVVKNYSRDCMMKNGQWKPIQVPKGYVLDKNSVYEGVDNYGRPYRTYTVLKIERAQIQEHKRATRKGRKKKKRRK